MNTSSDALCLDCAYTLVEYEGRTRRKRSIGKAMWSGCKQIFRRYDAHEMMRGAMLQESSPTLSAIRAYAQVQIASLPPDLRALNVVPAYSVGVSVNLQQLAQRVDEHQRLLADADRAHWGHDVG